VKPVRRRVRWRVLIKACVLECLGPLRSSLSFVALRGVRRGVRWPECVPEAEREPSGERLSSTVSQYHAHYTHTDIESSTRYDPYALRYTYDPLKKRYRHQIGVDLGDTPR
jgi:hypothetical protein